jgi:hypothetical protein
VISTTKKPKPTFDEPSAKHKKGNAPKVDKTGMSRRSNQSFRFPYVRPMFQLLANVEIQSSQSHLQRPSYVDRISERGNSIHQHCFLLLDIQCPNPGDFYI